MRWPKLSTLKNRKIKSRSQIRVRKKVFDFFSHCVPSVLAFSKLSGIDCAKLFFEIRPGTRFFELISILVSMRLYMDQYRNKLEKACSRSNLEKRFGAIDSWEFGKCYWGHIMRKNSKTFYDPFEFCVLFLFIIYLWGRDDLAVWSWVHHCMHRDDREIPWVLSHDRFSARYWLTNSPSLQNAVGVALFSKNTHHFSYF